MISIYLQSDLFISLIALKLCPGQDNVDRQTDGRAKQLATFLNAYFFFFFSKKCWESVRFAIAKNWFKLPMKVIDHTKALTQHFLENSFKKL